MTTEIKLHEIGKLLHADTHRQRPRERERKMHLHSVEVAMQFGWPFKPN